MPSWVEFHDSTLLSLTEASGTAEAVLDGFVHRWDLHGETWSGSGWTQRIRITINKATVRLAVSGLPAQIAHGQLRVGDTVWMNLAPIPLVEAKDATDLHLEFSGPASFGPASLHIDGTDIRLEPAGPMHYVEDLTPDLRPPWT